jgi:regulator of sirC expression with transglutaminase-like and TPR domain
MSAVERFVQLVNGPPPPLDQGALALAAGADPGLDVERWLGALDRLAEGVTTFDGLCDRLFIEEGFAGNADDYGDPRNSLLPHVLHRRTGIPITLAVVAMEVGRRAGVALDGIGMPGHFLVRKAGSDIYLDAFAGGVLIDAAGCAARFRHSHPGVPFDPSMLAPVDTSAILARMLENLRITFRTRRRAADLEWVLRMRTALPGATLTHLVELADALGEQARWDEAAALLEEQTATAAPELATQLHLRARSLLANLN